MSNSFCSDFVNVMSSLTVWHLVLTTLDFFQRLTNDFKFGNYKCHVPSWKTYCYIQYKLLEEKGLSKVNVDNIDY